MVIISPRGNKMREFDYSNLNNIKWDSEIINTLLEIQEHKGKQTLYLSQQPEELEKLVEIAKIQSTEYSNRIEGIITTDMRIKQLLEDTTAPHNRNEEEILGYRDVLKTIHESFDFLDVTPNYILQMHKILYRYSQNSFGGHFKNNQNYIAEIHKDGSQTIRFTPLAPYETPTAIDYLCNTFNKALDSKIVHPLLLIPIFIVDFLCIHPFNDGNGRMSRLLTTLLLYRSGYFVGKYISLEKKIENNKESYYAALGKSNLNWHEGTNDPTPFIKYLLSIILGAYIDFEDRVDLVGIKRTSKEIVLKAISTKLGKFTKNDLIELCPTLGKTTIVKNLNILVEENQITRHGTGKSTFYTRNL